MDQTSIHANDNLSVRVHIACPSCHRHLFPWKHEKAEFKYPCAVVLNHKITWSWCRVDGIEIGDVKIIALKFSKSWIGATIYNIDFSSRREIKSMSWVWMHAKLICRVSYCEVKSATRGSGVSLCCLWGMVRNTIIASRTPKSLSSGIIWVC